MNGKKSVGFYSLLVTNDKLLIQMYLEYMCTTPTTNNKTIDTSLFSLFYIFSSPDPKGSFFHHLVSVVRPLTFHVLIISSDITGSI